MPLWETEVDQHHPEVAGEVRGQVMPLKGTVQEPDLKDHGIYGVDRGREEEKQEGQERKNLRFWRDELQVQVTRLVHLRRE